MTAETPFDQRPCADPIPTPYFLPLGGRGPGLLISAQDASGDAQPDVISMEKLEISLTALEGRGLSFIKPDHAGMRAVLSAAAKGLAVACGCNPQFVGAHLALWRTVTVTTDQGHTSSWMGLQYHGLDLLAGGVA